MPALSFERLLKTSRLALPTPKHDAFVADRSIRLTRPETEQLEGKVQKARKLSAANNEARALQAMTKKLSQRLKNSRGAAGLLPRENRRLYFTPYFDKRQRAVVKIHYFAHSGGGAAALRAHGKYIARHAGRDGPSPEATVEDARSEQRSREGLEPNKRDDFYDKAGIARDGAARLDAWAKSDLRHFRIIMSAEEGALLRDLPAYTREVMARAGAALGTDLNWVAVDHHDTDNHHTHIVIRGRRANGQDLVLPRDFIKHGFRGIAQDVATEWLGERTPEQERLAYQREIRRHGWTKLDGIIDVHGHKLRVDLNRLEAPNGDPHLAQAAKARVQELARMGLAADRGHGVFQLAPDWRQRLKAMDLHLDVRRRVVRERVERNVEQHRAHQVPRKGLLDR